MSLSVLNNFELCYRGTSFKVQGGSVIAAFFLAHNYVSEQFGNYVEYGMAFNPLQLQYVILRTKSQNRCDSSTYIYVHGLCDRNMGLLRVSNRHFMVSPHEVFTCFRSVASISQHVY